MPIAILVVIDALGCQFMEILFAVIVIQSSQVHRPMTRPAHRLVIINVRTIKDISVPTDQLNSLTRRAVLIGPLFGSIPTSATMGPGFAARSPNPRMRTGVADIDVHAL